MGSAAHHGIFHCKACDNFCVAQLSIMRQVKTLHVCCAGLLLVTALKELSPEQGSHEHGEQLADGGWSVSRTQQLTGT